MRPTNNKENKNKTPKLSVKVPSDLVGGTLELEAAEWARVENMGDRAGLGIWREPI